MNVYINKKFKKKCVILTIFFKFLNQVVVYKMEKNKDTLKFFDK